MKKKFSSTNLTCKFRKNTPKNPNTRDTKKPTEEIEARPHLLRQP